MANSITYRRNGAVRTLPCGFSFTTLFFGSIPSFYRGHWQYALIVVFFNFMGLLSIIRMDSGGLFYAIGLRVVVASIRNQELHEWHLKDGWRSTEDNAFRHAPYPTNGAGAANSRHFGE